MENRDFVRTTGLLLMIGALVGVGVALKELLAPTPFGTTENVIMQAIVMVANAMMLFGVIGLQRSEAVGTSKLGKVGLWIALVASVLFLPFEVVVAINLEVGGALLGICALAQGLGLLLAGIGVIQARKWHGWHRFATLACGLYTFLVLIPALALNDGYSALALGGWQITFIFLGLALYQQGSASQRVLSASGVPS